MTDYERLLGAAREVVEAWQNGLIIATADGGVLLADLLEALTPRPTKVRPPLHRPQGRIEAVPETLDPGRGRPA